MEFWLRYSLALMLVGAVLGACALASRVLGQPRRRGPKRMEVVETLILGPQTALHLVRVDAHEILITTGPTSGRRFLR